MTFVVGVDGGGTQTRAVVVDADGRELGRAQVSGAVATAGRPDEVAHAVSAAVNRAAGEAGVALPAVVMWAGLAGAGNERARSAVEGALDLGLSAITLIGTDVEAAFHDAFGDGPGILLVAGTGSVAWARGEDQSFCRVGGWGQFLGDEGSGYALGLEALRRVTRSEDGRAPQTSLRAAVLGTLPIQSVEDLIHWVATATKSEVSALAPVVIGVADEGDPIAVEVVEGAVEGLMRHLSAAVVAVAPGSGPPPELVLWGGLVADGGPLRDRMLARLAASGLTVATRTLDPPMGAAKLALAALRADA